MIKQIKGFDSECLCVLGMETVGRLPGKPSHCKTRHVQTRLVGWVGAQCLVDDAGVTEEVYLTFLSLTVETKLSFIFVIRTHLCPTDGAGKWPNTVLRRCTPSRQHSHGSRLCLHAVSSVHKNYPASFYEFFVYLCKFCWSSCTDGCYF